MSNLTSTAGAVGVWASSRVAPVGRAVAPDPRAIGRTRDADTVVHLSDEARVFLAARDPHDEALVLRRDEGEPAPLLGPRPAPDEPSDFRLAGTAGDPQAAEEETTSASTAMPWSSAAPLQKPRSAQDQRTIEQLRARDVEVRTHEAAHAAVGGSLAGRPSLDYATGPDGKRYAVGGEVSIDTSPERTPEETIAKARTIRAAATAPASPSAQDMAVASAAARMESTAQSAIRERQQAESRGRVDGVNGVDRTERPDPHVRPASVAPTERRETPDPEMMILQLDREQASARGGMGHSHQMSDCGFCRRAVSAYA